MSQLQLDNIELLTEYSVLVRAESCTACGKQFLLINIDKMSEFLFVSQLHFQGQIQTVKPFTTGVTVFIRPIKMLFSFAFRYNTY